MKRVLHTNGKIVFAFFLISGICNTANAQEILLSSSGNTLTPAASVSYSVGQIFQDIATDGNNKVFQGIQFYFESEVLNVTDLETNLTILPYPNPTTSLLNVVIEGASTGVFQYQFFDAIGRLVLHGKLNNGKTEIPLKNLQSATYLLRVSNIKNKLTKTYRIIKN